MRSSLNPPFLDGQLKSFRMVLEFKTIRKIKLCLRREQLLAAAVLVNSHPQHRWGAQNWWSTWRRWSQWLQGYHYCTQMKMLFVGDGLPEVGLEKGRLLTAWSVFEIQCHHLAWNNCILWQSPWKERQEATRETWGEDGLCLLHSTDGRPHHWDSPAEVWAEAGTCGDCETLQHTTHTDTKDVTTFNPFPSIMRCNPIFAEQEWWQLWTLWEKLFHFFIRNTFTFLPARVAKGHLCPRIYG